VRSILVSIVAIALLAAAAWWALLFLLQRSVLYPAPLAAGGLADLRAAGGRSVWLELSGGRSEAWLLPSAAPRAPGPLLLFAHGNAELIDLWVREFETPRRWGASVLLVEYPGYGRSAGRPSQASIREAMVAAWDWARAEPSIDPQRVVGYGRSLGGGAVCALARERPLAALVLESTFTSVRSLARGFGLPGFLVRDPFDNRAVLRGFPGPILLLHGERDDVIPPEHAQRLHEAAPRSELRWLPCGHNDCPRPWALIRGFLGDRGIL